ncbi:MAG: hypothetical protein ACT4PO_16080 [Actinomycetota bacterium]
MTLESFPNALDRSDITVRAAVGDNIRWTTTVEVEGPAKKIQITVTDPIFTDSEAFDSGKVAIGTNIDSPAIRAGMGDAKPNLYRYTIRLYKENGDEFTPLRQTRNWIWVPGAADGTVKARGIFACSSKDTFCDNANHMRDVIHDGTTAFATNWAARPTVMSSPKAKAIAEQVATTFDGADDDDLSVLTVGGHGGRAKDGDEKEDAVMELGEDIRDDEFGPDGVIGRALGKIRGTKLLLFQGCRTGGMWDGRDDPPVPNGIVISSTNDVNGSSTAPDSVFGHEHSVFSGSLISGLLRTDPIGGAIPPVGVVATDQSPADNAATGRVTLKDWFDFGKAETVALQNLPDGKLPDKDQTITLSEIDKPLLGNAFVTPGRTATDLTFFAYARGTISGHVHADPPGEEIGPSECPDCDLGTCPDLDRDGDGYFNDTEATLGSDPDDVASTPESDDTADGSVLGSCLDKRDDDLGPGSDFSPNPGEGDPGCDGDGNHVLDNPHQMAMKTVKAPKLTLVTSQGRTVSKPRPVHVKIFHPLKSFADVARGLPAGHTETIAVHVEVEALAPELDGCIVALADDPRTPQDESESLNVVTVAPGGKVRMKLPVFIDCSEQTPTPGVYDPLSGNPGWRFRITLDHEGPEDILPMIRTVPGSVVVR